MKPWPRYIRGVTDHALVRFLERATVPGLASVAELIAQHRDLDDTALLNRLHGRGVVVGYFRKLVQDDADANKRNAQALADGKFIIHGQYLPMVVSRHGYVITCNKHRHASESLLPLFGRWRAAASA